MDNADDGGIIITQQHAVQLQENVEEMLRQPPLFHPLLCTILEEII